MGFCVTPVSIGTSTKRELSKKVTVETSISPPSPFPLDKQQSKSEDAASQNVRCAPERFAIARERVTSTPIPIAALRPEFIAGNGDGLEMGGLLQAYLGATMRAFAWTPQARVMARLGSALPDPDGYRGSFEARYLSECAFVVGDSVAGDSVAVLGCGPFFLSFLSCALISFFMPPFVNYITILKAFFAFPIKLRLCERGNYCDE
ncbi:hypothetical protein F4781DRAFT_35659 [Annulohypoxylon bovei var. microspora]|nr:hypothetical protein F4781DRAFT_35659 [Annulohypoxylon bovei var. microspora]